MNGETTEQLIGFVTGEGGTGKSMLIQTLKEYCQLTFGKQEGIYGSALAMAPTGCAASNIEGYTWQSITCCGFSTSIKLSSLISGISDIIIYIYLDINFT